MTGDRLAPFDDAVIEEVTTVVDVDRATLTDLLVAHQSSMQDLPGVENLMYEWRKQYEGARIGQTDDVYFAMVPETVWAEFAEAIDASAEDRNALREIHERQTVAALDRERPPERQTYVVLVRP